MSQREEVEKQHLSGFKLLHRLQGNERQIEQIAWSPDGSMLASASDDCTIRLWVVENEQLLHTFVGHSKTTYCVAWSPDGRLLASGSVDRTIRIWEVESGRLLQTLRGHSRTIISVAWSPDGRLLASGSVDYTIRLWEAETGKLLQTLEKHSDEVYSVAWSPDGRLLASGSVDYTIRLWEAESGRLLQTLTEHSNSVTSIAWSPDGRLLASGSVDKTIRIWDPRTGRQMNILEGHTDVVTCVAFSAGSHLLASKAIGGVARLWRIDTWDVVAEIKQPLSDESALAFHPKLPVLASLGTKETDINIWDLDLYAILSTDSLISSVHYTNAKVVLVGDSGVGKSGLSLCLNGQPFTPTESTHGRRVWNFDSQEFDSDGGRKVTREILLWDLAGQPTYRLVHQLHLNDISVALIVFDAHSETDPFAGVFHWNRALQQVQRIQGNSAPPIRKFLVAARMDRGGRGASRTRIDSLVRELSFDGYFETSAKEGWGIAELKKAIPEAIDWQTLPHVSSTDLFQRIKAFFIAEKETRQVISTIEDLYRRFVQLEGTSIEIAEQRAQFETCIGLLQSRDLIRQFSFGNLILLQPELLDAYASALVSGVKDEPDGLGSIPEEKAQMGNFSMSKDERCKDKEEEKLLLIAMIEDLLRQEVALREQAEDGPYLIFPSQSTRENPDLPDPEGKAVIFDFEGPILNIYATLAVRLSHSGLFKKKEMWRNAVTYTTNVGGTYGMFLDNHGEGRGEFILFFGDPTTRPVTSCPWLELVELP